MTGKKRSILGKRGRIVSIDTQGKSRKHRVAWNDNTEGEYSSYALQANVAPSDLQPVEERPNAEQNLTTPPSRHTRDVIDEGMEDENDSKSSSSDSDDDSEFGDREHPNELDPENGLPLPDQTPLDAPQPQ